MSRIKLNKNINKRKTTPQIFPDKTSQKEFEEFLIDREGLPSTREVASHGGALSMVAPLDFLGVYNPDNITIDIYNKMGMNPQLSAGLKLIKLPILGQSYSFNCESKEIAEFVTNIIRPLWIGLMGASLTSVDYGFAAFEKVWQIEDGKYVYKKFKSLYPEWIQIKTDKKDNFTGLVQRFKGDDVVIPLNKSLVFTSDRGNSFGNLFGISRLKICYETWYWWVSVMQFMLRYFEKKGTPSVVVRFPPGKARDGTFNADTALKIGKALISETAVALSSQLYESSKEKKWDVSLLADDKRGEMFISIMNYFDSKLLRGLFIPERVFTQDSSQTGSYAISKVHADMFLLGEEALIVEQEDHINKYILRDLVKFNFGEKAPVCTVKIERITDARKLFYKDVFMAMVKQGTAIPAVEEISKVIGIPAEAAEPFKEMPNVKNDKQNPEKEKEKREKLELRDREKWREFTKHENSKVLNDIEETLDKRQEAFKRELEIDILNPQIDLITKKVEEFDKKNIPLKNMWFREVSTVDDEGKKVIEKVPWLPLRGKLLPKIKNYMTEFYLFGKKTAITELKVSDKPTMDKETSEVIQAKSIAITDRYMSNLRYYTEIVTLTFSNKTVDDLVVDIRGKGVHDKMVNIHINGIAEQESEEFLNRGRTFIVKKHV